MARRYRRSYPRRYKPSYTVNRKVIQFQAWERNPADPQNLLTSATLIHNVGDGGNVVTNSGNKTVKHIEVQILSRPMFKIPTQFENQFNYAVPPCVWACVYVPEGTQLNAFFQGAGVAETTLYEPAQFVLGSGVIGGQIQDYVNEGVAGEEATFNQLLSSGNATRIRVPLSRRLNPGDKIMLILGTLDMAYGDREPTPARAGRLLVKYAIKYN